MSELVDRNGMRVLDRDECLRRLASAQLGRVGVTTGALPVVLPVLYRLDGERILIRCPDDSSLMAALDRCVVAFEVDAVDAADGGDQPTHGWSVVVTGLAEALGPDESAAVLPRSGPFLPEGGHLVAISTERMTGRELPPPVPTGPASRNDQRGDTR